VVKRNRQLPDTDPVARAWGARILQALAGQPRFVAAALPLRTLVPLFSRHEIGDGFGAHVDNAIRPVGTVMVRTDLATTLFLSPPQSYGGGALAIEIPAGSVGYKLAAGDMLLYPATSRHAVEPVTAGVRLAAIIWVQSLVRDAAARALLFDLDMAVQALGPRVGANDPSILALTSVYHNLLRRWAAS
jgi:PKHD-type hydroxylase